MLVKNVRIFDCATFEFWIVYWLKMSESLIAQHLNIRSNGTCCVLVGLMDRLKRLQYVQGNNKHKVPNIWDDNYMTELTLETIKHEQHETNMEHTGMHKAQHWTKQQHNGTAYNIKCHPNPTFITRTAEWTELPYNTTINRECEHSSSKAWTLVRFK